MIVPYKPRWSLRGSDGTLSESNSSYSSPRFWINFPSNLRAAESVDGFKIKNQLKIIQKQIFLDYC